MSIFDYQLPYSTITGTFVAVDADSVDEGLFPDIQPLNGTITLTPTTVAGRVDDALAHLRAVTVKLLGGQIVDDEGQPGVRILATDANIGIGDWAWTADFKIDGMQLDRLTFKAPRDTTVNITSGYLPIQSQPYQIVEGASIVDAEEGAGEHEGKVRFLLSNGETTKWIDIPNGEKGDPGAPGEPGEPGPPGQAATITLGSVAAGPTADAWVTGTEQARELHLVLPRGPKGDKGDTGTVDLTGYATEGYVDDAVATLGVPEGAVSGTGVSQIVALTQAEYDALTPDPRTLYIVTGETVPPDEPPTPKQGTLAAPAFGAAVYGGSPTSATSLTVPRPDDLADGDVLIVALRSQDATGDPLWEGAGFTNVAPQAAPGNWASSRVAAVMVKPITDITNEPTSYTFAGPSGRNVAIAVACNVGTTNIRGVSSATYGGTTNNGVATLPAHTLDGVPAVSLVAMGAECTEGISGTPSDVPDGFAILGSAQSSLDSSTIGSRTVLWLGWKAQSTTGVPTLVGGFAGAAAPGVYAAAIAEGF